MTRPLINLMVYVGLFECFEPGWGAGQPSGAMGVLELLGSALLAEHWADDPLWAALAHPDGRAAGTLPSAELRRGACYHLPSVASRRSTLPTRAQLDLAILALSGRVFAEAQQRLEAVLAREPAGSRARFY